MSFHQSQNQFDLISSHTSHSSNLDGETVLNALKKVFYEPPIEPCDCEGQTDFLELPYQTDNQGFRRTSGASSVSGKELRISLEFN